jgi:pyrroline-5-carboxylate reductase
MDTSVRVGIIGGNGWIGGALARAMVAAGLLPPASLTLSCRSEPPDWLPEAVWTHDNQALADSVDIVVLSVRPQDWPRVRISAAGKLVVSVMAGVPLAAISASAGTERVVRALPNAAAEVGKSYTPWAASAAVTDADRAIVRRMFESCGTVDEVPREADIDYLSGYSGTGPAYPALLAAAMMQDAIAHGIPRDVARRAVVGLLIGTGRIFEKTGEDPAETVAAFVSYRGVTAAAIEAMVAGGFQALVSAGLSAALKKAASLGRESEI